MRRAALGACAALALAGCATGGKPSASQSVPLPEHGRVGSSALPDGRKRSPYAAAQEDPGTRGHYTRGGLYKPGVADTVPDYIPDVDAIPEPEVVDEPRSRYGNRSPYVVLGKSYQVRDNPDGYVETGLASYYGNKFHGRRTSNLEVYDMYAFTAAHKSLPLPSFARVTNLDNGKSVVVRVNDRGPFHEGRVIDLSYAAAVKLGYRDRGTARVEVRGLGVGEDARHRQGMLASAAPAAPAPQPATPVLAPTSAAATAPRSPGLPPGVRIATGRPAATTATPAAAAPGAARKPDSGMDRLMGMLPIASANAGERPPQTQAAASPAGATQRATGTASTAAAAAPAAASSPPNPTQHPVPGREWRFDMLQDGKAMSADEFDAWMKSRQVRVATGKPVQGLATSATAGAGPAAAAPPPPSPQAAAAAVASQSPAGSGQVTLQVASFANQTNAGHALAMLRSADITGARLLDASVNGKPMWRLRVGPVDAARAPELAARVVGLGFDQPQRIRGE